MRENKCYIASAGSGKTTKLINIAIEQATKLEQNNIHKKIAIIAYTINNQNVIKERLCSMPYNDSVVVLGWFEFLLKYFVNPYKTDICPELLYKHIGLNFSNKQSSLIHNGNKYYKTYKVGEDKIKFFGDGLKIYSDKISEFAMRCIDFNDNHLLENLEKIFDTILFDESQDYVGYDYAVLKCLIKSNIFCCIAGDPRQTIYSTHPTNKYKQYRGQPDKFCEKEINTLTKHYIEIDTSTLSKSKRCPTCICNCANKIYDNYPPMESAIQESEDRHCVFIHITDINKYAMIYNPIALIWNKNTSLYSCNIIHHMNMGESKGEEFDNVIIFPTSKIRDWIMNNNNPLSEEAKAKFYVAITRARKTVAIVVPDNLNNSHLSLPMWGLISKT